MKLHLHDKAPGALRTVGDLIDVLSNYHRRTLLVTTGVDIGGYDAELQEDVLVHPFSDTDFPEHLNKLYVGGK